MKYMSKINDSYIGDRYIGDVSSQFFTVEVFFLETLN